MERKRRSQRENQGQLNLLQIRTFRPPKVPAASLSTQTCIIVMLEIPSEASQPRWTYSRQHVNGYLPPLPFFPPSSIPACCMAQMQCICKSPAELSDGTHAISQRLILQCKQYTVEEERSKRSEKNDSERRRNAAVRE